LESPVWCPASIPASWETAHSRKAESRKEVNRANCHYHDHRYRHPPRAGRAKKGFALDAAHRPHISMFQCFVPAEDLDKVYAALVKVLDGANVTAMSLEGFKYYYLPAPGGIGGAGIVARPTPELLKLQADLIAAASPFTVETGTIAAFTASHDDAALDAVLIAYVSKYVPEHSGDKFVPHVTTGVAPREYLDKMLAEPFEPFAFSPAGAAVYQLGPYGTAAKKLKEFDLKD
jgi:hypothetical protein